MDETEIPNGFSRADGLSGRPGTTTPANAIRAQHAEGDAVDEIVLQEQPDSPEIERAEQSTISHTMTLPYGDALTRLTFLGRGTLMEDEYGNESIVLSSRVTHQKGGMALLTVVGRALFDPPPDEFNLTPVELGINIIKHPRYFYAFLGSGYGSAEELQNQMVIRLLQDYFDNASAAHRDAITAMISGSIGNNAGTGDQPPPWNGRAFPATSQVSGTDMAKRAALEIIQKYWRGTETPYIVGFEMTWRQHYFIQPELNPGGIVEDPIYDAVPQVPLDFVSVVRPPDIDENIFQLMPGWNPQCYSDDGTPDGDISISWLRKADRLDYNFPIYTVTRTWWGSPVGYWDEQIYSREERPQVADDYLETSVP